jgi:hypothetical protein
VRRSPVRLSLARTPFQLMDKSNRRYLLVRARHRTTAMVVVKTIFGEALILLGPS